MSSSKTPIRQDEKDYLDHFIETKYDDRKNVLKTEMQDTIDKEAEDNFEAFKDKLKITDFWQFWRIFEFHHRPNPACECCADFFATANLKCTS